MKLNRLFQATKQRVVVEWERQLIVVHHVKHNHLVPPQPKPLAEVKDKAAAGWQAEQKQERATKQAEALASAAKPDQPLAKAAGDKGLTLLAAVPIASRAGSRAARRSIRASTAGRAVRCRSSSASSRATSPRAVRGVRCWSGATPIFRAASRRATSIRS